MFGLNFHHFLTIFLPPLQVCDSISVCFAKCVFLQLLLLSNATSFVYCQIFLVNSFFFFFFWHNVCCSSEGN